MDKKEESTCCYNSRETTPKKPVKKFTEPKVQDAEDLAEESSSPLVSEVVSSPSLPQMLYLKRKGRKRGRGETPSHLNDLEDTNQSNDAVSELWIIA